MMPIDGTLSLSGNLFFKQGVGFHHACNSGELLLWQTPENRRKQLNIRVSLVNSTTKWLPLLGNLEASVVASRCVSIYSNILLEWLTSFWRIGWYHQQEFKTKRPKINIVPEKLCLGDHCLSGRPILRDYVSFGEGIFPTWSTWNRYQISSMMIGQFPVSLPTSQSQKRVWCWSLVLSFHTKSCI